MTKSVVSTLVGIAIAEGKIRSLDATLPELLPRDQFDTGIALLVVLLDNTAAR